MSFVKVRKFISGMISLLLLAVLLLMVFVVISSKASGGEPQILGYQIKTVLSGSMEPTFETGSIIAVEPIEETTKLQPKDVITFTTEDNNIVTHRIVEVIENGEHTMYQTKGDNNKELDTQPVLSANVMAKYTGFTIPYLGYFIDFAKSSKGSAMLLIIPGVLLLIYSAITIISALKSIEVQSNKEKKETA